MASVCKRSWCLDEMKYIPQCLSKRWLASQRKRGRRKLTVFIYMLRGSEWVCKFTRTFRIYQSMKYMNHLCVPQVYIFCRCKLIPSSFFLLLRARLIKTNERLIKIKKNAYYGKVSPQKYMLIASELFFFLNLELAVH